MTQRGARRIAFLTGTRADFGKLKSLMLKLVSDAAFEVHVFVTGMHMLSKYGYTCEEVENAGLPNIYKYINQNSNDSLDHILAKTVTGLSDYVKEISPDLLVIHGDRVEALAGASVGALGNTLVGHIEGGEVSGTVDELIRHAVSKLSHRHFVANELARGRLVQLGETEESVHVIGSPDIDAMNSQSLPTLQEVRTRYGFDYRTYAILMFHPVTSELQDLRRQIRVVVSQVLASGHNYIVVYPNNDPGSDLILEEYAQLEGHPRIKMYPSMRFEYFLTLLRNAQFIVGNSSAGVREAPHYGIPAANLGTRQHNRVKCPTVIDAPIQDRPVAEAIASALRIDRTASPIFGSGDSAERFHSVLKDETFWEPSTQKYFVDRIVR